MTVPPGPPVGPVSEPSALVGCVRHPDRLTALRCTRCDRPACTECLRPASVGHQCVDCVAEGQRTIRQPVTIAGAQQGRKPVVMPVLVGINVIIFVITAIQARSVTNLEPSPLFQEWVLWPIATRNGGWWQLVTSGFLHINPIHIAMNMVALWVIGRDFERILGPLRFAVIYLVALLGGSVAVFLFGGVLSPEAGASGAVYGLMGGLLVVVLRLKVNPGQVIGLIAINLAISVALPGISLLGHLGGLVTGAALTAAIIYGPKLRRTAWQVGSVVAIVVVLVGLVLVRDTQIPQTTCVFDSGVSCDQLR